jgi:hypothetical protein
LEEEVLMTTAEYVDCQSLPPGSLVDVETKNRTYHIEYLGGNHARISGHPEICPKPVSVKLQGSSDKQGVLEPDLIRSGRYLQFLTSERRPVKTSRVQKVRVHRPTTSSTIH